MTIPPPHMLSPFQNTAVQHHARHFAEVVWYATKNTFSMQVENFYQLCLIEKVFL